MHSLNVRPATATMRVLCVGAHADDIEIGCGGLLLRLIEAGPKVEIDWIVFSASQRRERETRRSAELFLKGAARSRVSVKRFRDGFFPPKVGRSSRHSNYSRKPRNPISF